MMCWKEFCAGGIQKMKNPMMDGDLFVELIQCGRNPNKDCLMIKKKVYYNTPA